MQSLGFVGRAKQRTGNEAKGHTMTYIEEAAEIKRLEIHYEVLEARFDATEAADGYTEFAAALLRQMFATQSKIAALCGKVG